jgi:nanoRNase/pAp phosphatase (c-di-AMP/oligoRNAs hydrolase)
MLMKPLVYSAKQRAHVLDTFDHHPPTSEEVAAGHEQWREACQELVAYLLENLGDTPESREALSLLRAAMMWGNASIAVHGLPS